MLRENVLQKCVVLMMLGALLFLMGCETTPKGSVVAPLVVPCPATARAEVQAEPIMPEDAEFNASADRWLFAELLPWARMNARSREATRQWCESLAAD